MKHIIGMKSFGSQVLLMTTLLTTLGTIIAAAAWTFFKNPYTFTLMVGFSGSMIFHWSFFFLYRKARLPKKQSDHLIAFFSCLLVFFLSYYQPLLFPDMWVLSLFYPIILGILGNKVIFKIWSAVYLILFHFSVWLEPGLVQNSMVDTLVNISTRSSIGLLSCMVGLIILVYHQKLKAHHSDMTMEKTKRHIFRVLHTLTPIVERKSQTSRNEIEEFRSMMKKVADFFPEEKITDWEIDIISLLHYVSRINWPDYMFEKKEKLTQFEYEVIQEHCYLGAELIGGFQEMEHIKIAFLHHHERLDGTGYPAQLAGDQISFLSQLIAVTESYVAMTTSRSYRHALSSEEAFTEIQELRGLAYREEIVDALERALELHSAPERKQLLVI